MICGRVEESRAFALDLVMSGVGAVILTIGHLSKSYLRGMKGTTCIKL